MRTVTVQAGVSIDLGHQYDNYATEVVFPSAIITPFITNFGSTGTFAIWYRRSGDSLGYPIGSPLVMFDSTDSEVTWDVVESDTASPGTSQIQLRYIVDEVCVMSQIFSGNVADSVDTGEEVPEPMEQWADAIVSAGAGGQPTVATSASAMADHNTIYLYTGSESGYIYGHIYYWNGSAWTDGGAYGGGSSSGSGLTEDIKQALLNCFEHVAWTDEHGQDYVDALEAALYPPAELSSISAVYTQSGTVYTTNTLDSLKANLVVTAHYTDSTTETVTTYTLSGTLTEGTSVITVTYEGKTTTFNVTVTAPATLSSITAVYTQSGTVYDTDSLDSLKSDLVVTAVYSDSSTETVASTDYTLSGTLTEGTSTITVSYGGKTTTFTVTVTEAPPMPLYNWDFTQSLVDSVGGITAVLSHNGSTDATRNSSGLSFTEYGQCCDLGAVFAINRVIEIDFTTCNLPSGTGNHIRSFMIGDTAGAINGVVLFRDTRWTIYNNGWWTGSYTMPPDSLYTYFANKTVTLVVDSTGHIEMLVDGVSIGTAGGTGFTASNLHLYLGNNDTASNGANFYNVTITGVRVYNAEV